MNSESSDFSRKVPRLNFLICELFAMESETDPRWASHRREKRRRLANILMAQVHALEIKLELPQDLDLHKMAEDVTICKRQWETAAKDVRLIIHVAKLSES